MVRMAHPTDMAIPECHDFATHQSFTNHSREIKFNVGVPTESLIKFRNAEDR